MLPRSPFLRKKIGETITKMTKSDKSWTNGYFLGFESGEEHALVEIIQYLKKALKHKRQAILRLKVLDTGTNKEDN